MECTTWLWHWGTSVKRHRANLTIQLKSDGKSLSTRKIRQIADIHDNQDHHDSRDRYHSDRDKLESSSCIDGGGGRGKMWQECDI